MVHRPSSRQHRRKPPPKADNNELEVEYNVNPTKLFEFIDRSQWEEAADQAHSVPMEARTWLVSKGAGKLNFRYLPLHLCLQFNPPYEVVEALVDAYDEGVRKRDHEGRLPLHHVCHGSSLVNRFEAQDTEGIVDLLVSVYPESIYEPDEGGRISFKIIENAIKKEGRSGRTDAIYRALMRGAQAINGGRSNDGGARNNGVESRDDVAVAEEAWDRPMSTSNNGARDRPMNRDNDVASADQSMIRLVIRELEAALTRAKDERDEIKHTNDNLQKKNDDLNMAVRELNRALADAHKSGHDEQQLIEFYENQINEVNKDNDECREKLREQAARFDVEFRSMANAHETAIVQMNTALDEKEAAFQHHLSEMKNQLLTLYERTKALEAAEETLRVKNAALEVEKEDMLKSIDYLQQAKKEEAHITKTAYERRISLLEADLAEKDATISALEKVKTKQEEDLKEQRAAVAAKLETTSQNFVVALQEHETQKRRLASKVKELESKVTTIESELLEERRVKGSLKQQIGKMEFQSSSYEMKVRDMEEKIQDLESKRASLKDAISKNNETFQSKVKSLNEKKKSLVSENLSLKSEISELKEESASLKQQSEENKSKLQKELRLASARHTAEIAAERKHAKIYSDLREEISNLRAENSMLEERLALRGVSDDKESASLDAQIAVESSRLQISSLEDENERLRQRISGFKVIEIEKDDLDMQVLALKARVSKQEDTIKRLNEKINAGQDDIETTKGRFLGGSSDEEEFAPAGYNLTRSEIEKLVREANQLRIENRMLKEKVNELEVKKAELKDALGQKNVIYERKVKELNDEKNQLQSENVQLKNQLQDVVERNLELESKRANLKDEVVTNYALIRNKVKDLRGSKDALESENASLRNQLYDVVTKDQSNKATIEDLSEKLEESLSQLNYWKALFENEAKHRHPATNGPPGKELLETKSISFK